MMDRETYDELHFLFGSKLMLADPLELVMLEKFADADNLDGARTLMYDIERGWTPDDG